MILIRGTSLQLSVAMNGMHVLNKVLHSAHIDLRAAASLTRLSTKSLTSPGSTALASLCPAPCCSSFCCNLQNGSKTIVLEGVPPRRARHRIKGIDCSDNNNNNLQVCQPRLGTY